MYNIFINEHLLQLCSTQKAIAENPDSSYSYMGRQKFIYPYIDKLEKSDPKHPLKIVLYHDDLEVLWKDFQDIYKIVLAAGGIVRNEMEEILSIYRLEYWDLPKGKVDKGEAIETAAAREVLEETGMVITDQAYFDMTFHTYRSKSNKRVLKKTYWYHMRALNPSAVHLQAEEGIEDFRWICTADLIAEPKLYASIRSLLSKMEDKSDRKLFS